LTVNIDFDPQVFSLSVGKKSGGARQAAYFLTCGSVDGTQKKLDQKTRE
jgi:hypothetical protein